MNQSYDVIIVGAGPVGLFLACELAAAGVSLVVLEREEDPKSPWKEGTLGRRGLLIPSLEAFYRRGMLDKIFSEGKRPSVFQKITGTQFAGHFAGITLDGNKIDFSRWKYRLQGPSLQPGPTTLGHVEAVLSEHAYNLGVQILRGVTVSSLTNENNSVKVRAGDQTFEAQWLVGCDGGRSAVRREAEFDFVGTDAAFVGYAVMCDLDDPECLKPGFNYTDSGMYIKFRPGALHVVDFDMSFDRSQAITREHLETVLRRVSGTDIAVEALHLASSFTDRSKQATQYRRGRILLAGDSAHIHSPLGAQGLNTGIGDAMNLGWKLAATVKGSASSGLLDTYHEERHPVAARVLEWTRAQVSTIRPDLYGKAVAQIIRDMIKTEEGTNYFVDRVWGLSQRYDLGDVHPVVGRSAPDFEFEDGSRLGPKLEKGRFFIVDFEHNSFLEKYALNLSPWVDYFSSQPKEALGLKALLLRPDGVVAWASDDEIDLDLVDAALRRWINPLESGK